MKPASYKRSTYAWSAMFPRGRRGLPLHVDDRLRLADSFTVNLSITLLALAWSAGFSTWGPLLGGLLLSSVPSWSQDINKAAPGVIFGLLIVRRVMVRGPWLAGLAKRTADCGGDPLRCGTSGRGKGMRGRWGSGRPWKNLRRGTAG